MISLKTSKNRYKIINIFRNIFFKNVCCEIFKRAQFHKSIHRVLNFLCLFSGKIDIELVHNSAVKHLIPKTITYFYSRYEKIF